MNNNEEFDVAAEEDAPQDKLDQLHKMLEEAIDLEALLEQSEETAKAVRSALHKLRTGKIPDLMAELQLGDTTFRGWKVNVDDFVSGSLPKDPAKRQKAIEWLDEHEAGGLIKTKVAVEFGREQREEAMETYERLNGGGLAVSINSDVHAQTLQSFARTRIKDGDEIDTEALGLFTGKIAKMKRVKEK